MSSATAFSIRPIRPAARSSRIVEQRPVDERTGAARGYLRMPMGWVPERAAESSTGGPSTGNLQTAFAVGWEINGPPEGDVIVALGGISATRHVAASARYREPGWWENHAGPGKALDTLRFRVLGIDYLGSPGGKRASRKLGLDPKRDSGARPPITPIDQAHAVRSVLGALGIDRVRAIVGSSYGGMVALAFGLLAPQKTRCVVALAASHRPHPLATALRSIQRRIVQLGIQAGRCSETLSLARELAFTTYRTAEEFEDRFEATARPENDVIRSRFEVEDYLGHQGDKFVTVFDPESFLTLSESIDLCDLNPEELTTPLHLISFQGDAIAPEWLMDDLASRAGGGVHHITLPTHCGHDGFLMESPHLDHALRQALTNPDLYPRASGDIR